MAKPLLILLHGMGSSSDDWAQGYVSRLKAIAATYPSIAAGGDFAELVELKSLNYGVVFQNLVDRWEEQDGKVTRFLKDTGVQMPRVAAFLKDPVAPPEQRGFFWTHVLHPVTYRGTTVVRDEVRALVLRDLVETVNTHLRDHPGAEVSVLGYSLGTIVTHDVLHLLGSGASSASGRVWSSDRFRFANVFLLANATRLGPPSLIDFRSDRSVVRPVSAGPTPDGLEPYIGQLYSFRNRWDPVASWQPFDPDGWGPGLHDVALRHIRQVNIHGLAHYLEHPEVHVRIFRALLGTWVVPGSEWQERVAEYPDLESNVCGETVATLMHDLDHLRDAVTGGKLDDVAMGLLGAYRAIKKARESCEEMYNRLDGWL
jgi:hypothetical protein